MVKSLTGELSVEIRSQGSKNLFWKMRLNRFIVAGFTAETFDKREQPVKKVKEIKDGKR
jgi:hypothetical protein